MPYAQQISTMPNKYQPCPTNINHAICPTNINHAQQISTMPYAQQISYSDHLKNVSWRVKISLISRCFLTLTSKYSPFNSHQRNMFNDQNDCHPRRRTRVEASSSEILFWDRHQTNVAVMFLSMTFSSTQKIFPCQCTVVLSFLFVSSNPHSLPKRQPHEPDKRQNVTASSFCKMGSSSLLSCLQNLDVKTSS
jgi:hypothetical protein